jgi:hypothetical protein
MTPLIGSTALMSENATTQPNSTSKRADADDKHALAQVEKWIAMIRELGHERQEPTKLRA